MKSPILSVALSLALWSPLAAQDTTPAGAKPAGAKPAAPAAAKPVVPSKNVTIAEAEKLIKETPGLTVLDVRSPEEFEHEHIKGAVNINVLGNEFEAEIAKLDPTKPVLVHCAAGRRSSMALEILQEKTKVPQIYHMNEGFSAWKKAGKPAEGQALPRDQKPEAKPEAK